MALQGKDGGISSTTSGRSVHAGVGPGAAGRAGSRRTRDAGTVATAPLRRRGGRRGRSPCRSPCRSPHSGPRVFETGLPFTPALPSTFPTVTQVHDGTCLSTQRS